MTVGDLASLLDRLARDDGWRRPDAFLERADLADRLDLLLPGDTASAEVVRAAPFLAAMEASDARLFQRLREAIRAGRGALAMAPWLRSGTSEGQHYDALDALLAGVLAIDDPMAEDPVPPPGMVFYQPTPARHILECVRRAAIGRDDVVLDLGSGLGHVPLLVNILTGARTRGVEREPAYVESAARAADALGLRGVSFLCADARDASLADVDVVYLFTPFVGEVLADVLVSLERAARARPLRIVTLGPCSATFARQAWLRADAATSPDRVAVFRSLSGAPD